MLRQISAFLLAGSVGLALSSSLLEVGNAQRALAASAPLNPGPGDVTEGVVVAAHAMVADVDRAKPASPCPGDMVWIKGEYCTEARQTCLRWLDDEKLPYARCGEYSQATECVGARVAMGFCIDRYEYTAPGEDLPVNFMSFEAVSKLCKQLGKRVCTESEWTFACEGEEMRPYPYGYSREPKCNQDRDDLTEMKLVESKLKQVLKDHRKPSTDYPECASPFGVFNMVGNLDEPVLREEARFNPPFRNGLKGGWWMPARNRCRPVTTRHDDYYKDIQVGARCCADVPGSGGPTG